MADKIHHSWESKALEGRDRCYFCGFLRDPVRVKVRRRDGTYSYQHYYYEPETKKQVVYRPCDASLKNDGDRIKTFLGRFEIEVEARRVNMKGARLQLMLRPQAARELIRLLETRIR